MSIYLTEGDEAAACVMYRSASEIVYSLLRAAFKLFHDREESVSLWSDLTKFVGLWGAKYMASQKWRSARLRLPRN
ncbi:hypothetical protein F4703DRAFT_1931623 [Phycomyces blakesleeanus]